MTAGLLHHLGVWMGDQFFETSDWNPKGFFADELLNEMHWRMIRADDDNAWHIHPVAAISEEYREEIQRRATRGVPWGFKLTETPAFLHHLQVLFPALRVVRTQRRFASSVRSWERWNHGPRDTIQDAILRIAEYTFAIDEALERCGIEPFIVEFEALVTRPVEQVTRLAEWLELPATAEAVEFVDASLKRF